MCDVIQRLRASKIEEDSAMTNEGRKAGYAWAKNHASAVQLRRLQELFDSSDQPETLFVTQGTSAYCGAETLAFSVEPETEGDRTAARDFWEPILDGRELPEDRFVQGFAEGALALWNEVRDQL